MRFETSCLSKNKILSEMNIKQLEQKSQRAQAQMDIVKNSELEIQKIEEKYKNSNDKDNEMKRRQEILDVLKNQISFLQNR